jgi:uncharacterized protein YdeI (BOF family)
MKFTKTILIAGITALLSTPSLAAAATSVKNMPDGSHLTVSGVVEEFDSEHAFMLRDSSGFVKVDLSSAKPMVLKNGEKVTVTGVVNQTILGVDIVASRVSEDKGVGEKVGEAINSVTGQDAAGDAQAVSIRSLPKSGLVKINGIVDSVDSEKNFKLKDSTGHIDVTIKSGESASLNKGTPVTVIGYVDNGLLEQSINATEVDVRSNGAPTIK